jgi:hypothetical protein
MTLNLWNLAGKSDGKATLGKRSSELLESSAELCRDGDLSADIKQADTMLVREMNALSMEERDRILAELHGVVDDSHERQITEGERSIETKLEEMDKALTHNIKAADRQAYDRALFLSPRFVTDKEFRKAFLRAECYDPSKAAVRFNNYFHYKLALFGEGKLCKRIEWHDLDKDEQDEVMTGSFQHLPEPDRQGRSICLVIQKYFNYKSWQTKIRACWYMIMCELENENTQKKGIVTVFYNVDTTAAESLYLDLVRRMRVVDDSLPYRNVAVHYCYNNPGMRPALNLLQLVAGKDNRLRFRTHFGSHIECQFALMTFGINRSILPFNAKNEVRGVFMENFLKKRLAIEAKRRNEGGDRVDYPTENDCLLGRGRPYQDFPGNVQLSKLINSRREEYNRADRWQKTVISYDVARTIADLGGRFLQRDNMTGGWKVVDEGVARDKVASSFRVRVRLYGANTGDITPSHRQKRSKKEGPGP